MDKYQHYKDALCGLLSGLEACEVTANKHLSEPIAVDPKNLQRQLEEAKVRKKKERSSPSVVLPKSVHFPSLSCSFYPGKEGQRMEAYACLSTGSYSSTSL